MATAAALGLLDAATHASHALHGDDRAWPETNCYVDLWIESLHALRLDPTACLAFTLTLDFEGDQYTFFKFPLADLETLYGIEVQELNVWRDLLDHAVEQTRLGRIFIPEVDAFFLPDTAGLNYRTGHGKTSVAIHDLDPVAKRLGYFHNRGYHTLEGDDFDGVFRLGAYAPTADALPPYVEIAKLDRLVRLPDEELVRRAVALTRQHLARRPARNPIAVHRERLGRDIEWLRGEELSLFHLYAFATFRQAGACYALTASFLRWLGAHGETGLSAAAEAFDTIGGAAKALQFKLARVVGARRDIDLTPLLDEMERAWDTGMAELARRYGE